MDLLGSIVFATLLNHSRATPICDFNLGKIILDYVNISDTIQECVLNNDITSVRKIMRTAEHASISSYCSLTRYIICAPRIKLSMAHIIIMHSGPQDLSIALRHAACLGYLLLVDMLLKYGAGVEQIDHNVLIHIVGKGYIGIFKRLVSRRIIKFDRFALECIDMSRTSNHAPRYLEAVRHLLLTGRVRLCTAMSDALEYRMNEYVDIIVQCISCIASPEEVRHILDNFTLDAIFRGNLRAVQLLRGAGAQLHPYMIELSVHKYRLDIVEELLTWG